jgi:hypothetical protein
MEGIYRYRFQGQIFAEREGFISSSDAGASFHYSLPGDHGDLHAGVYNGETFMRAEVNDQKGIMLRASVRPLPGQTALGGLRIHGFYDHDAYVKSADRRRAIVGATFEHPHVNAGGEYLAATDQPSASTTATDAKGFSVWGTPRVRAWEGLLRYDSLEPNTTRSAQKRTRTIAGVAYWFAHQGSVATALLFDVDQTRFAGFSPAQPTQRRLAVHALVSY